ncbi:M56 family metallopeptidase [Planctomycetota bacterium]
MNAILEHTNSVGSAFVEFVLPMLIQSSILIIILLALDFLIKKKVRAVFRYCLWMLVLVKLILPTTLSLPTGLGYWFGEQLPAVGWSESAPAADSQTDYLKPYPEFAQSIVEQSPETTAAVPPERKVSSSSPLPKTGKTQMTVNVTAGKRKQGTYVTNISWRGALFVAWAMVVIIMFLLLLQRAIFVLGLIRQAKEGNELMEETLNYCRKRMYLKTKVRLKVSANATSPAVCGLLRPVILVPQNLGPSLGVTGLRTVLLHELAHIKRGDLWVNLVQTLLQIIYFYNPLLWLANAIIRKVREQAVDETVQAAMGEKAKQYPETLVNVAKLAFKQPALSLRLVGVVESKSALKTRIKRMLNRPIPKSAKLGIAGFLAIVIIAAVLLPMAKAMSGPPNFTVKGTVTDAETGEPIAGAKVGDVEKYAEGEQWTTTDANGNYEYKTWYEEHAVKCEIAGYETQIKGFLPKLFGLDLEKERVFDFELARDGNRLAGSEEKQFYVVWWMAGVEKEVYDQLAVIAKPIGTQSDNYLGYLVDSEKLIELISENSDTGNIIFTSKSKFLKPTSEHRIASSWADSGNLDHPVFVGFTTGAAGPYKLLQNGDDARLTLEYESVHCLLNSGSTVQGSIFYDGNIEVDKTLVYTAKMPETEASKPYHLVMYLGAMIDQEHAEIEDPIKYYAYAVRVPKRSPEYKATLPNGVTVELVGVCEFEQGKGQNWWKPDGNPYETDIHISAKETHFSENTYGFVFKTDKPAICDYKTIDGMIRFEGRPWLEDAKRNGNIMFIRGKAYYQTAKVQFDDRKKTSIRLSVLPDWKIKMRYDGKYALGRVDPKVAFLETYETGEGVKVIFEHGYDNTDWQMVALLPRDSELADFYNGRKMIRGRKQKLLSAEGEKKNAVVFEGVKLSDVVHFEFQVREGGKEWIEFKNVSLKPNFKTDVQIEVQNPDVQVESKKR